MSKNSVFSRLLGIVALGWLATGCSSVQPDAGVEAVLIHKPIFFGHGGVDKTPISTGRTYVWWTTDEVYVDMQPQQFSVHFDDLQSKEGIPLDFDATIRLKVTDSTVLVEKFGKDWYEKNVKTEFMNRVRQAVRKHGMNETAISTTAIDEIDNEVTEAMKVYLETSAIPINLIQVTVGKASPPDEIKNQRIATAAQEQRKLTMEKTKEAEDARKLSEQSRAAADNAYREAMELNPAQFLQLEQIKMTEKVCAGGKCTFLMGGGNGVTPIIDVTR